MSASVYWEVHSLTLGSIETAELALHKLDSVELALATDQ